MTRCASTAPDDYRVGCELSAGHEGMHRSNMVVWNEPLVLFVGGEPPDLNSDSEAWVDGQVRLAHERGAA